VPYDKVKGSDFMEKIIKLGNLKAEIFGCESLNFEQIFDCWSFVSYRAG
jgi:hypothetical protein